MKTGKILLFLLCITFISCGEDRRPEYAERTNLTHWIDSTMRDQYLWWEDIPEPSKLNYHERPETFFSKLLSSKDGKGGTKFSREDFPRDDNTKTRSEKEPEYGFEYITIKRSEKIKEYYARVLYTVDNSPASEAGLERGEWIFKINGKDITPDNIKELLMPATDMELETGYVTFVKEEENATDSIITPIEPTTKKSIAAARILEHNPILYSNIDNLFEHNGKKIGYLVYNSFRSGKDENDINDVSYLDELSTLSNRFKAAGVQEFILDLRYNLGGELNRPVPLMCTMLAPETAMGELMGYTIYNSNYEDKHDYYYFSTEHLRGGSNLNLKRVFILVNKEYTASASEAVINFLKPYMANNVFLIGNGTYGKNVGSQMFEYEINPIYKMYPIVFKLANADHYSDYTNGFSVDKPYNIDDSKSLSMLPFGNPEEALLKIALGVINGTFDPEPELRNVIPSGYQIVGSSLDRHEKPTIIIR